MRINKGNSARRVGLARALSKLGFCSRSQAAGAIRRGRVRLNGRICRDPESSVHIERDEIAVDGSQVERSKKIYLALNKPRGVVTTASDERGRETVYAVLQKSLANKARKPTEEAAVPSWIAPVGRLDKASEGLLLLTNDSEWGARIAAPRTHLEKTYHVQIAALVDDAFASSLVRGIEVGDGKDRKRFCAREARILRRAEKNCWLEIILDEGRNRQIRRMLAALEIEVLRLVRVAIGPLRLGNLAKGDCRPLTKDEKQSLDNAMRPNAAADRKFQHE